MPDRATPRSCFVIGAGLAGAAVAAQLARRGWRVRVLDSGPQPASGASGLPAGLVVPHVSPDDNLLARATRAGTHAMWAEVQTLLLQGEDYALTGVREYLFERGADRPHGERWHALAGWIKPAQLIKAWLQHPHIEWVPAQTVQRVAHDGQQWLALDAQGACLASAAHGVLCAGHGTTSLLPQALPLQALRGQLSWDVHGAGSPPSTFPPTPVNGQGNLIAAVPTPDGPAWFLGSTFVRDDTGTDERAAEHLQNLQRLQRLAPATAGAVRSRFEQGQVRYFGATRCAARDRMPVVGPAPGASAPGLWLSTAMGARGLSLALLCAQMLAAQMSGDAVPVEAAVQRALSSARKSLQRALHRA